MTFKEQVIKPDQNRWEKRIQWLLEDEFGTEFPLEFHFVEMDLADEEQIARTHSYYTAAATNNEVRAWAGLGRAGIDPETGDVEDPALEEWGRQPFEGMDVTPPAIGPDGARALSMSELQRVRRVIKSWWAPLGVPIL